WVGGRAEAASLHSAQSPPLDSAHDFFAEKRGEVGGVEKGAECLRLDRKANHVCPSLISSQGYSVSRKLWKHSGSLIDHSSCFIKYAVMLALPAKYDKMKSPMALPRKAENQQSTIN
ncbi:hypothetical protein DBR06_SOUSAS2610005, partial [Sousa chinensis]